MKRMKLFSILVAVTLTLQAQTREITILAVNDMHAALDRFPKFVALVDSMRTLYPDLLLVAAGDNRTGNPANDMYPDSYPMVALMNKAGFNLSIVGNHEFDGKVDGLRSMVNNSNFRYICANMYAPDSMRLHVDPYRFFDVGDVRIGALGLLQISPGGLPDGLARLGFYKSVRAGCLTVILIISQVSPSVPGRRWLMNTAGYGINVMSFL